MLSGLAGSAAAASPDLELAVSTDKAAYRGGEPIAITLRVALRTGGPVVLEFSSGQRFDVVIRDTGGGPVWRWSADQMFTQVLGTESLDARRSEIVYRVQFTGPLAPGSYRVEGTVVASNRPLSAATTIRVQ